MLLQGWVYGILINESSVYGTLCIILLKTLKMGLQFSEIDTRGWPYRRQDLLLLPNHTFALQAHPNILNKTILADPIRRIPDDNQKKR